MKNFPVFKIVLFIALCWVSPSQGVFAQTILATQVAPQKFFRPTWFFRGKGAVLRTGPQTIVRVSPEPPSSPGAGMAVAMPPDVALSSLFHYQVVGDESKNVVHVTESEDGTVVGKRGYSDIAFTIPSLLCQPEGKVVSITVYGADGDDDIRFNLSGKCPYKCVAFGGNGTDDVRVQGCREALIHGEEGGDFLWLGTEEQKFRGKAFGDDGDDFINYSMEKGMILGGAGNDQLLGYAAQGLVSGDEGDDYFYGSNDAMVVGADGVDTFSGGGTPQTGYSKYKTILCDPNDKFTPSQIEVEQKLGC
jgi:hypothetical protein